MNIATPPAFVYLSVSIVGTVYTSILIMDASV